MIEYGDFRGRIYLAGPLFSLAERTYIEQLVAELERRMPRCVLLVPHCFAASVAGRPNFLNLVFDWCLSSARSADAVVAILDGADADSGTCIEMGTVYPETPIIGVRTDFRALEDQGVNVMVSKLCREMIWLPDTSATIGQVADRIVEALRRVKREGVRE